MVHDFPDTATFLSPDDRTRVLRRLKLDGQASASSEEFSMKYLWQAVRDPKTWLYMVIYMGCVGSLYAFSLFVPTIINELKIANSPTEANLLTVPPYALAAIATVIIGYVADRTGQRGFCNIGVSSIAIVGFIMLIASTNPRVKYAGCFLGALGIYPCIANTITWAANNTEGVYKRGVTLGFVIGWGNLNGVVSSNIYRDPPRFFVGHGVVLAYLTLFLFGGSIATRLYLASENKRRRTGKRGQWIEGMSEKEVHMRGDRR